MIAVVVGLVGEVVALTTVWGDPGPVRRGNVIRMEIPTMPGWAIAVAFVALALILSGSVLLLAVGINLLRERTAARKGAFS
jgi:hypothetical protein